MRFLYSLLLPLVAYGIGGAVIAGVVMSANGPSLPVAPAAVAARVVQVGNADADSTAYDTWINDTIAKLSGDDATDQNRSADQLAMVVVYPPDRQKVLAALQAHLNGDANDFRLRCVKAYGHWATPKEVPQLVSVVGIPQQPKGMSGAENVWAAAVAAMVDLDSKAAEQAMQTRTGSFFFRTNLGGLLGALTTNDGPGQPAAFALLKELDPSNDYVTISVPQAMQLLQSDSADKRTKGAHVLTHAIVLPDQRAAVLGLLQPHLMGSNGGARLPFVEAYAHWADKEHVKNLIAAVGYPETVSGLNGHENCWAAATVGLARLDPRAAADAVKSRSGSFFYRSSLHGYLEPIAQGNGPDASCAEWLLDQLEQGNNQPPLPPKFDPTAPASPSGPASLPLDGRL